MPVEVLIVPILSIIGGFVIGWLVERIVLFWLARWAARTPRQADDAVLGSLKGAVTLWATIGGIYIAAAIAPIDPAARAIIVPFLRINIVVSIAWVLMRVANRLFGLYVETSNGAFASSTIFLNLTRILIGTLGVLIVLQGIGIEIAPLLTTLGVGGIAIALALQDTLSNVFAGVYIIVSKKIKIGDFVKLDTGDEGYVTDINWRNTTIRALTNNMIVVPNAKVASSVLTNYYLPVTELAVLIPVGVSYDSDLERVEQVTVEVAREVLREVQGGVPEFEPFIRYGSFSDFSITFNVILRGKEFTDQFLIKHEFIKRLHRRYKQEGIEIPFPIRQVRFMDGALEQAKS